MNLENKLLERIGSVQNGDPLVVQWSPKYEKARILHQDEEKLPREGPTFLTPDSSVRICFMSRPQWTFVRKQNAFFFLRGSEKGLDAHWFHVSEVSWPVLAMAVRMVNSKFQNNYCTRCGRKTPCGESHGKYFQIPPSKFDTSRPVDLTPAGRKAWHIEHNPSLDSHTYCAGCGKRTPCDPVCRANNDEPSAPVFYKQVRASRMPSTCPSLLDRQERERWHVEHGEQEKIEICAYCTAPFSSFRSLYACETSDGSWVCSDECQGQYDKYHPVEKTHPTPIEIYAHEHHPMDIDTAREFRKELQILKRERDEGREEGIPSPVLFWSSPKSSERDILSLKKHSYHTPKRGYIPCPQCRSTCLKDGPPCPRCSGLGFVSKHYFQPPWVQHSTRS